ncbi:MAG: hypothetical protein GF416_00270 [Candidatus Altiarchaeales archaeon]|nr:hypothetical protein [Candidatus Altiarchaeales archaeon]MBD3415556.1 hypothetical protein [Candidatus Altiarchaeales archaeon]
MTDKKILPIIKEIRIKHLIESLVCFDKYPYDRENQRDCVLRLYPDTSEKSTFRGMVIPSLRYLGLIIGYEDLIKPSANGKLVLESLNQNNTETLRVFRALLLELDDNIGFSTMLIESTETQGFISKEDFFKKLTSKIGGPSKRQIEERINKWLGLLDGCGLIVLKNKGTYISLNNNGLSEAKRDLDVTSKRDNFRAILFKNYDLLSPSEKAGGADITKLRELVAVDFYNNHGLILTEYQFDELLRSIPLTSNNYIISLGLPIGLGGIGDRLFKHGNEYYKTIYIKYSKDKI